MSPFPNTGGARISPRTLSAYGAWFFRSFSSRRLGEQLYRTVTRGHEQGGLQGPLVASFFFRLAELYSLLRRMR
jgi:hypothetical protein